MKIAILGWGSLIWNPDKLGLDKTIGWSSDGPNLPIEFARISNDKRLTLVIKTDEALVQTLFAISLYTEIDEAVLDLAIREGCAKNRIGYFIKNKSQIHPDNFLCFDSIKEWINGKNDIDAVIWTNLSSDLKGKIGDPLTPINAVNYLKNLSLTVQPKAEEYFRKTPIAINTSIRKAVEEDPDLNWKPIIPKQ